jgi:hypothetical protein
LGILFSTNNSFQYRKPIRFSNSRQYDSSQQFFSYEDDHAQQVSDKDLLSAHPSIDPAPPAADTECIIGRDDPMDKSSMEYRNIFSQNVRGWRISRKKESIIETMIKHNLSIACIQETWEADDYVVSVRGHLILHHNISSDYWARNKKQGGIRKGVVIILSPEFAQAYIRAGSPPPITTNNESSFTGRFIGITLDFPITNHKGKSVKNKRTKLFIASIYHPW